MCFPSVSTLCPPTIQKNTHYFISLTHTNKKHTLSLSLSLSLSHTHTHTHKQKAHTLSLSLTHKQKAHTLSLSPSLSHTLSLSLSHTNRHTHTHTPFISFFLSLLFLRKTTVGNKQTSVGFYSLELNKKEIRSKRKDFSLFEKYVCLFKGRKDMFP